MDKVRHGTTRKKIKHEKSATVDHEKRFNMKRISIRKKVQHEKSTRSKRCNTENIQLEKCATQKIPHEESATQNECNTKKVQHEMSAT